MSDIPAIAAEEVLKHYGKTRALAGLNLTVPQGTVYGLLGPNGAGKTTAVRVFATLLRPDGGRAQVLGHDVVRQAAGVRRVIGLTGQYAALDEYLTGRANLIMIGQLSRLTAAAARRRADELLERFDLTEATSRVEITLAGPADREAATIALKPFAQGNIQQNDIAHHLSVPVIPATGLTTQVVRALDIAGVEVDDITIRRASLDDVFFALTGHATEGTEAA